MRTTLDLPEELLEEARCMLGFQSKTDTVVFSLTAFASAHLSSEAGLAALVVVDSPMQPSLPCVPAY